MWRGPNDGDDSNSGGNPWDWPWLDPDDVS